MSAPLTTEDMADRAWHAMPPEDALEALQSDAEAGLSADEAAQRRQRFGENRLTPQAKRSTLMRLLSQADNLFIYFLLTAAVATALLGEWLDSGVIVGVVMIIVIIGFVQEGRAERALEAVRGMLAPKARVVRSRERRGIAAEDLVPGDIVLLESGDQVPADIRLLTTRNLQAQEAILTGESTAVEKNAEAVAEDADLGDRSCMMFSGTLVTAGKGTGVVVATGDASEIGRISGMLSEIETIKTPLMQRLDGFTKTISVAIIGLAVFAFAVGVLFWEQPWSQMFFAAVSIAVAAIPEGLPAVMTVTLAIGVQRMAQRNAIIRRLPAVETLGSVTIICSDKTGTLTRNEMTAKTVRTAESDIEVEGIGYAPDGGFLLDEQEASLDDHPVAREMIRAGLLCNDAQMLRKGDDWTPDGDPMEAALIVLAHKAGMEPDDESKAWGRLDAIPFASEHRYMATLNRDDDGRHVIFVKGAPEQILEMCTREQRGDTTAEFDMDAWHERIHQLADRGQRVLAVAHKPIDGASDAITEADVEQDLILLGLFGLIDPSRQEAIDAVATCRAAGIRVKMVTGDHKRTAQAIARELGLEGVDDALTGRDLEELGDDELRRRGMEVDVFARASPEHKLRLVKAFQAEHQVTAMTGDGVNDAPALKRADIGIAMGQKGTDAAREAAAMVLADDNFQSIEQAVKEGRTVFDNVKKSILFLLPINAAESMVIFVAVLAGMALPITPVQILWVNMVSAATLGMALAWERSEGDIMHRPPRRPDEPLLTPFLIWRTGFVGLILLLGAGSLFILEQANDATSLEFARTVAVNALVTGEIFYLVNARFRHAASCTLTGLFGSRAVMIAIAICVGLQVLFIYAPFMNTLFGTEPLDLGALLRCIAVGVAVFILVELEKLIWRRWRAPQGGAATAQ